MVGDFGFSRTDIAVTRAIDNSPSGFVPTIGQIRAYVPAQGSERDFRACEKGGCADGWRPAKDRKGEKAVIRCQCFLDWVAMA